MRCFLCDGLAFAAGKRGVDLSGASNIPPGRNFVGILLPIMLEIIIDTIV